MQAKHSSALHGSCWMLFSSAARTLGPYRCWHCQLWHPQLIGLSSRSMQMPVHMQQTKTALRPLRSCLATASMRRFCLR